MKLSKINDDLLKLISGEKLAKMVPLSREVILADTFGEGERHNKLVKLAGALSRQGLSVMALTDALMRLNEVLCVPLLPYSEVRSIATGVIKYRNYERNPDFEPCDTAQRVRERLHSNKGNVNKKNQEIADFILKDLVDNGRFYRTNLGDYYYFDNATYTLKKIERESIEFKTLLSGYGLNPQMPSYKFVSEAILIYAHTNGTLTNVYKFAHYDKKRNLLYVKHSDSDFYRITLENIELCPNGTDDVLFTNLIAVEPYEYLADMPRDIDYISDLIINLCSFDESEISADVQAKLVYTYLIALIMPEFLATKPILVVTGTKGAAKTTFMKCAAKTCYGSKANVNAMPNKFEDLDILVINNHFLNLDNVDSYQKGINDKLAVYATGGCVKKRKLYTDSQVFEAEIDAFIAMTTRTLFFKRDDVLQRLVLISLKPIEGGYIAENDLLKPVLENRNCILTQMFDEAQVIMRRIATGKYNNFRSDFRMADFAKFMAILMDNPKESEACLRQLTAIQRAKCIENDIIMPYLLAFTSYYEGKFWTAQDIFMALEGERIYKVVGSETRQYFVQAYPNVQSFAKRLNNIKDDIREYIIVKTQKGRANTTLYSFEKGARFDDLPMIHMSKEVWDTF